MKLYRLPISHFFLFCIVFSIILAILFFQQYRGTAMQLWHTEKLSEEFTAEKTEKIKTFADYLLNWY